MMNPSLRLGASAHKDILMEVKPKTEEELTSPELICSSPITYQMPGSLNLPDGKNAEWMTDKDRRRVEFAAKGRSIVILFKCYDFEIDNCEYMRELRHLAGRISEAVQLFDVEGSDIPHDDVLTVIQSVLEKFATRFKDKMFMLNSKYGVMQRFERNPVEVEFNQPILELSKQIQFAAKVYGIENKKLYLFKQPANKYQY